MIEQLSEILGDTPSFQGGGAPSGIFIWPRKSLTWRLEDCPREGLHLEVYQGDDVVLMVLCEEWDLLLATVQAVGPVLDAPVQISLPGV